MMGGAEVLQEPGRLGATGLIRRMEKCQCLYVLNKDEMC